MESEKRKKVKQREWERKREEKWKREKKPKAIGRGKESLNKEKKVKRQGGQRNASSIEER